MKKSLILLILGGLIGAAVVLLFAKVNFGDGQKTGSFDLSSKIKIGTSKTEASGLKEIENFKNRCAAEGGIVATTEEPDGSVYLLCIKRTRLELKRNKAFDFINSD